MWPFRPRRVKDDEQKTASELQAQIADINARLKAAERTLDEQHDFIRRLAARRAAEVRHENERAAAAGIVSPLEGPDGVVGDPASRRAALRAKARQRFTGTQ